LWKRELLKDKEVESNFNDAILKVMKSENSDTIDIETRWQKLKESILHGAKKVIGVKGKKREKKPWITEQLIDKMEERRKWKNVNGEEGRRKYRQLNNELRRMSDRAKEQWLIDRCTEIEKLEENGQVDVMYRKVKELTDSDARPRGIAAVMDRDGNLLTSMDDIKRRWKTYIEDLYNKQDKPIEDLYNKQDKPTEFGLESEKQVLEDDIGPEVLNIEVEESIRTLTRRKAEGMDGIPAEFVISLHGEVKEKFVELCQLIYRDGVWPKDFLQSVMIPIEKKKNAVRCEDFRTISLISHASKVVLRILAKRIESKSEEFLGKDKFGFRSGRGTRDAIGVMRCLSERSMEFNQDLYVCFIDYEKAFDRVNWRKLMEILHNIGVD